MSQKISITRNFIYNLLQTVSNFLFPLITFPYVSRKLLAEGIGNVDFATSVINYFIMFASLGIPTYGIRACAQCRDDKKKLSQTVQELLIINLFTTAVVLLIFLVTLVCIPKFKSNRIILLINGVSLLLNCIGMNWLYSALEQYRYITIRSLFFKLLSLLAILFWVNGPEDTYIYAAILVFSSTGANLLNFFHSKTFVSYKKEKIYDLKQHFTPIFTFFATSVAISIYTNLDVVMLGFMCGDQQVGYYSAAIKIRSTVATIVTSLGVVILPKLLSAAATSDIVTFEKLYAKSLNFTFFTSIPLTLFFMICAKPCIYLLAGTDFQPAVEVLLFLMPTVFFAGLSNVTGTQLLIPWGKENKLLCSIITGALIDFFANFITIPLWGAKGAALSTLIAEVVVLAVQIKVSYVFLKRQIFKVTGFKKIFSAGIAGVILVFFLRVNNFSNLLLLCVSGIIFFGIYILCLLIIKDRFVTDFMSGWILKLTRQK